MSPPLGFLYHARVCQRVWRDYYRRWRLEPDWAWPTAEPFLLQHRRLVDAARRHELTRDPLSALDRNDLFRAGVAQAAAMSLTTEANAREVAPPLEEILP